MKKQRKKSPSHYVEKIRKTKSLCGMIPHKIPHNDSEFFFNIMTFHITTWHRNKAAVKEKVNMVSIVEVKTFNFRHVKTEMVNNSPIMEAVNVMLNVAAGSITFDFTIVSK